MEASACRKYNKNPFILIAPKFCPSENRSIRLPKVQNGSNSLPKVQDEYVTLNAILFRCSIDTLPAVTL
jgi:hypothetical protein